MRIISFSWKNEQSLQAVNIYFEPWGMGPILAPQSTMSVFVGCFNVENDIQIGIRKKNISFYCGCVKKMKVLIDGKDVTSEYPFLDRL